MGERCSAVDPIARTTVADQIISCPSSPISPTTRARDPQSGASPASGPAAGFLRCDSGSECLRLGRVRPESSAANLAGLDLSGKSTDRTRIAILGHLLFALPPPLDRRRLLGHFGPLLGLLDDAVHLLGRQPAHLHQRIRLDDRQIIV